jgi:hypothetical protein
MGDISWPIFLPYLEVDYILSMQINDVKDYLLTIMEL